MFCLFSQKILIVSLFLQLHVVFLSYVFNFRHSDMDQLTQIMKVTGTPGPEFIDKLESQEVTAQKIEKQFSIMWFVQYVCILI